MSNKEKIFKPNHIPEDMMKFGVYFKSENDISTEYLIELCEGRFEGNALVKIYSTDLTSNYFETDGLTIGSEIGLPDYEIEWLCEVDLCGKYFFPKFKNDMQLYYDDKKYYKGVDSTNSITSLMEAINYAIEYGLIKSGINPY